MPGLPSAAIRMPLHAARRVNRKVQKEMMERVRQYEGASEFRLKGRLHELEAEWDTDLVLETNAAGLVIAGVVLAALHSPKWLILSGLASVFALEHALQGWCPPLSVIRRLGIRTVNEIESEKEAIRKVIEEREKTRQLSETEAE